MVKKEIGNMWIEMNFSCEFQFGPAGFL
jgi:hypothetical protein